ncbi:MAG TPA: hypothetical protein VFZ08_00955 [Terriglobia bacterium]|nr:hypothetical protein [Terriglobia bacterium]
MAASLQGFTNELAPRAPWEAIHPKTQVPLLKASSAWLTLRHRTGIPVARATFYRWISNGKVFSLRMGLKVYVPLSEIEELVKQCESGERL